MKKLFLPLFLIISSTVFGQGLPYPNYQQFGSQTTRTNFLGAANAQKGFINGVYTDTTQANLGFIDFYPGAQIYTTNDSTIWLRNNTATRWIQQGSISNITINNIINNSTTSITNLTDSSVKICTGDGSSCDTIFFSTAVTNITTTFFITDSSFVVCDSLASCDTIIIPSVGPLYIFQNWVEQRFSGIVEWGGLSAGAPSILLHDTYNSTEWWKQFYYSKSLRDYGYQFHSLQGFHETPGIMSWRSQGTYPTGGSHIANTVRLGVNFTDTVTAFSPATTGIFGNVHNGYFISSNLWGGDPQGTVRTDDFLSKSAGVFFHTKDLSNSNKNAVSIFGQAPIGSANTGGIKLDTTLIASFKTDKNLQLYGYPDSRDDGGTSKALFTDTDGNVLYGPVNTGDIITIITDSSISICSNVHHVTSLCDTFVTNVLTGPIQTVEILNDSTIVVCDSLSVCDTLTVPQTNFSQPITANNGLIMSTPTNVQLGAPTFPGAPLLHHTYIDATANYTLRLTGSIASQAVFQSYNTGTGQAILAQATGTGTALNARNLGASGTALNAYSANGLPVVVGTQPASTNTVVQMIKIQRETSGTAANGIGASTDFISEVDNGNSTLISNRIISKWTDAAIGSYTSQLILTGVDNTTTADLFTLSGSGSTRLNKYGIGTFTGTETYLIATDAIGNLIEFPSGGLPGGGALITANNGLTMSTGTNVQLGGTLLQNTTIATAAFNLLISTSTAGVNPLQVTSTTNNAIYAVATSADAINAQSTGGFGITTLSFTSRAAHFVVLPASTNTVVPIISVSRISSGTAADGIGGSIDYFTEDASGSPNLSTTLVSKWTTADNATRTSQFTITGVSNAVTADLLSVLGTGQLQAHKYGIGTFTGTATKWLAVTSTGLIIEEDAPSGVNLYNSDGTLLGGRTVSTAGFNTTWTGSNLTAMFQVVNTNATSGAQAITAQSQANTSTITGQNLGSGSAVTGTATSGTGVAGVSTTGLGGGFTVNPSSTTTVVNVVELTRNTTGTAANGMGGAIQWTLENSAGTRLAALMSAKWGDVTDASRTGIFTISTADKAVTREKLVMGGYTNLTESSATTFHSQTVSTGTVAGGEIVVTVHADDATDFQSRTLRFIWTAENKAGTTIVAISTPEEAVAASSGTLTVTITAVDGGTGVVNFQADAASSLTQTTLRASAFVSRNF